MLINSLYQNFQHLDTFSGHNDYISQVLIGSDNQTVYSASGDSSIKVWNVKNKKEIYTLTGHSKAVNSIAVTSDDKILVSTSEDSTIKIWNLRTRENIFTITGHSKPTYSVVISPDGQRIATSSSDKTIRLWDLNTGKCINSFDGHKETVHTLTFSPNGHILASGSSDTIKLWNLNLSQETKTLNAYTITGDSPSYSDCLIITKDNTKVISASGSAIDFFDLATGKYLGALQGDSCSAFGGISSHAHSVNSIAISHDNSVLISGSQDPNKHIAIWDLKTGKELHKLINGENGTVYTVAISPDKQTIVSGDKKSISIWGSK
jgi:WD40 repeat protein